MLLGNSIAPVIRLQSTIFYVTEVGLNPIVGTHITVDGVMGQLFALNIQTACRQSEILETERIFVISARVCLVGNHEQEYFVGELADKHGFYFGRGSTAAQSEIFHHHVSDGIETSTGGRQHPFQTQLFRRGQFNPACLQSGRFYDNFERRLIGHEQHHEKFLPGPSQYEPHIDIIGNQTPLVYQIEMQFTSQIRTLATVTAPHFFGLIH